MPSFYELRNKLEDEFDCTLKTIGNNPLPTTYFERTHRGKKLRCPINLNNNEVLTPIVLRYICRRLKIDPTLFGLILG